MDSKKVIAQLIKIAEKQQKIINKLAQALPDASNAPQDLAPNAPKHVRPVEALKAKIKAKGVPGVIQVEQKGQDLVVVFQPGQMNASWDKVQEAYNEAVSDQSLPRGTKWSGKEA